MKTMFEKTVEQVSPRQENPTPNAEDLPILAEDVPI
jgi:hypothetical protein